VASRHEEELTERYRFLREMYGGLYSLMLFVQLREYERVRDRYPDSYDDIVESDRMSEFLYML